jgi:hypothetical protein
MSGLGRDELGGQFEFAVVAGRVEHGAVVSLLTPSPADRAGASAAMTGPNPIDTIREALPGTVEFLTEYADRLEHVLGYPVHAQEIRKLLNRAEASERRADDLADALRHYADARHWGVERDRFEHPAVVWIGPGADEKPVPNPALVARAALDRHTHQDKAVT